MGKYVAIFRLSIARELQNYKALIGLSIFTLTCLLIFAHLWRVMAAKVGASDLNPDHLLWYIAFNEWVLISIPDTQTEMEYDLRSGRLAYLLPRPISYLGSIFSEALGLLFVNLTVLGIVAFSFTYFQVGALPFSTPTFFIAIILGVFASMLGILFQMIIGLSAFWIHEVQPIGWIWEKLLFIFGGLILPLTVYPAWMQKIASFTPFPLILGGRSALVLDSTNSTIAFLFLSITLWLAIAAFSLIFVYRRGLRILNIEGG